PGTIVSSGCDRVDAVLVSASLRAASLGQLRDRVRDVERRDDPDRTIRSVPEHDQVVRLVFVHQLTVNSEAPGRQVTTPPCIASPTRAAPSDAPGCDCRL